MKTTILISMMLILNSLVSAQIQAYMFDGEELIKSKDHPTRQHTTTIVGSKLHYKTYKNGLLISDKQDTVLQEVQYNNAVEYKILSYNGTDVRYVTYYFDEKRIEIKSTNKIMILTGQGLSYDSLINSSQGVELE